MTHPTEVTINAEMSIYVIPAGEGYSYRGFESLYREACQLAEALSWPVPVEREIGTMSVYNYHREMVDHIIKNKIDLGTWFDSGTEPFVKSVIEAARQQLMTIRIFYGETDPEKENYGLSWMEEFDVTGRVGRSTGVLKVPILVPAGDDAGSPILTRNIIKIVGTRMAVTLYEHPAFRLPSMEIKPSDRADYREMVVVDGKPYVRFKREGKAQNWIDFMSGRRMKP